MKIIGIAGMVGSGKSEILKTLDKNYNCLILVTDEIAAEFQKPKGRCYEALKDILPRECFGNDGVMDRKRAAEYIFSDKKLLEKVNAIVHPAVDSYIRSEIKREQEQQVHKYIFVESALLFESGLNSICDETWYIYVRPEVRIKRLKEARGYSEEKIQNILKKQKSDEQMRSLCTWTIDNSDELTLTMSQISFIMK